MHKRGIAHKCDYAISFNSVRSPAKEAYIWVPVFRLTCTTCFNVGLLHSFINRWIFPILVFVVLARLVCIVGWIPYDNAYFPGVLSLYALHVFFANSAEQIADSSP